MRGGRVFIVAVTIVKRSIERHLRVQDMHVMVCVSACDRGGELTWFTTDPGDT